MRSSSASLETLQVLKSAVRVAVGVIALALQLFHRRANVVAARVDRTKKTRECQTPDIGIRGTMFFARHRFIEIGEFAFEIGFHLVERAEPAFQLVDAKTLEAQQRVLAFHFVSPIPAVLPRLPSAA